MTRAVVLIALAVILGEVEHHARRNPPAPRLVLTVAAVAVAACIAVIAASAALCARPP